MELLIEPFDYGGAIFRVGLADSKEERESCYRLRYRHFCEARHEHDVIRLNPDNYPDGLERDEADKTAHLLIATMTNKETGETTTVGTFRFNVCTLENPGTVGHPFLDGVFELPASHKGKVVRPEEVFDAGRWVGHDVQSPKGDQMVNIAMMMVKAGMVLSEPLNICYWAVIILVRSAKTLRSMGWPIDAYTRQGMYCNLLSEGALIPLEDYNHPCPYLGRSVQSRTR